MSEPTPQDPYDAARDRLTDRVLAEALGGEQPPDLADAILERSADAQSAPVSQGARMMRNRRAWIAMFTTAASLAAVALWWRGHQPMEQEVARNDRFATENAGLESTSSRVRSSPRGIDKAEATIDSLQDRLTSADKQLLRESLASKDGFTAGLGGDRKAVMPEEMPIVYPDAETWERATSSRSLYKRQDANQGGAQSTPPNAPTDDLMHVTDGPESGDFYGISSTAEPQTKEAGQSLPSPYYLTDDVEYFARPKSNAPASRQLAQSPQAPAEAKPMRPAALGLVPQLAPSVSGRRARGIRSREGEEKLAAGRYYAGTEIQLQQLGDAQTRGYPQSDRFGFYNPEGRRWPSSAEPPSADRYTAIQENAFVTPKGGDALSTFSIDVDTASYANVRQYLMQSRRLPPAAAVRVEELINYFDYGYQPPAADSEDPFTASMEVQACPWKPNHQLVRIGIKGREVAVEKRPLSNLVFLVDVSGSMNQPNKLPLVVSGLKALTDRLGENDRVAIVVYAGSEGVVLPSTSGEKRDEIRSALGRLQAGGSTAGGAGLKLAYEIAERNQIPGGVNRVVLCTDGDFNVGLTGTEELTKLVETRAKETGVFLTVLGFGRGNLNDAMLESISGRGDGNYAYIDSEKEARRVLSRDLSGTLVTIAKDVKLQVEFNPAKVASYRLVGYENRVMAAKDFNDDTKDAGEIGAGHTVTALYEVVPVGAEPKDPPVDNLKYQPTGEPRPSGSDQPSQTADNGPVTQPTESTADAQEPAADSNELLTLKIRYKQPTGGASKKLEFPLEAVELGTERRSRLVSDDFRWAAAVAEFGLLLRGSQHAGDASFDSVLELARTAIGDDPQGYRAELLDLVLQAKELRGE